jgi:hypothetical protein
MLHCAFDVGAFPRCGPAYCATAAAAHAQKQAAHHAGFVLSREVSSAEAGCTDAVSLGVRNRKEHQDKMKVTFKTLDHATFEEEVGAEEGVEDLISRMEDRLGQENLYRLIYAGKMMKEGEMVSDYKMTGRLPVVVMVTKLDQFRKEEREAEDGPKAKRVRTESEDSGFGEDSEEGEEHYVTDREFSIALEVVMTCQHFRRPSELVSDADMRRMVEETFPSEAEVREIICSRMEQLEEAGPTREQFKAFILDIQSMYQEGRVVPGAGPVVAGQSSSRNSNNSNAEVEAEAEELDETLLERNLRQLEGMGFPREQAAGALGRSSGSLQVRSA